MLQVDRVLSAFWLSAETQSFQPSAFRRAGVRNGSSASRRPQERVADRPARSRLGSQVGGRHCKHREGGGIGVVLLCDGCEAAGVATAVRGSVAAME